MNKIVKNGELEKQPRPVATKGNTSSNTTVQSTGQRPKPKGHIVQERADKGQQPLISWEQKPRYLENVRELLLGHFSGIKRPKHCNAVRGQTTDTDTDTDAYITSEHLTLSPSTSSTKAIGGQPPVAAIETFGCETKRANAVVAGFSWAAPCFNLLKLKIWHQERGGNEIAMKVESNDAKMQNDQNNETRSLTQSLLAQKPRIQPKYTVNRDVLTHEVLIRGTGYEARDKSIPYMLRHCCQTWSFFALFGGILPFLQWLPKYSLKRDLVGDIMAGFTVAIMHIPHGMAYGLLAGVSPGTGLYMAIFPALTYMLLGTSKHISIGTFAVISLMTLKVVQSHSTEEMIVKGDDATTIIATATATATNTSTDVITPLQVVTALSSVVGIVHCIMFVARLGMLASLLSEPLVYGFTTAAAFHVISSQLKDVFGLSIINYKGAFKIVYTLIDVILSIKQTNIVTLLFCISIIIFMIISNELVKPYLRQRCRFAMPSELMAVIGGTLIARYTHVQEHYGVTLVGTIPRGLPTPELPRFDLFPALALDSIAIAIVSFSIVISMGLTFAKKHSYEVDANQELFALGGANLVGGCFACLPIACSLSRSIIQEQAGGVTQLASAVSAILIVMTLYFLGPFFSTLPKCVLAGVIIVALKPMLMQIKQLSIFAKQGKLELLTWIATFFAAVLIDIDIGLFIGVIVSLLALYIKGVKPSSALMGVVQNADAIYVDLSHHSNAVEVPETKIFRYTGSLNFATKTSFRRALYQAIGNAIASATNIQATMTCAKLACMSEKGGGSENGRALNPLRYLILDFTMIGHIDVAGCHGINEIMRDMNAHGIRMFIAGPMDCVYDTIVHSMVLGEGPFEIFPTLHDAVLYVAACRAV